MKTNRNALKQSETNLQKKATQKDVRLHKQRVKSFQKHYNFSKEEAESAIKLLDEYLAHGYTEDIVAMVLKNQGKDITKQVVRNIKLGKTGNSSVFKYMIEFAADKKAEEVAALQEIKTKIATY